MFDLLPGLLSTNARRFVAAFCVAVLLLGAAWIVSDGEEAAGQGQAPDAPPAPASPSSSSPSAASPSAASAFPDDLESLFGDASASALAEEEPEGIPDLGAIDVVGNLKHLRADRNFPCEGPTTGDRLITWSCLDPSGRFAVEVVAEDPLTVLSVTSTARGVPEEETEEFFGYVLDLCLEDAAALDPEAWVSGNVPSGGQTFAGDVGVAVYGSEEVRALEVSASGLALD